MHAARPEFDDSVARLVGDDAGVHLEGIHTLSKTAQPAFKRAVEKGGRLFGLKNTKPLAYVRQSIDLRGLLDGVGPRPIFSRIKKMRNFSQAWMECGSGCVFHTALRVPLSTMRGLLDLAPTEVKTALWTLPTSAQLAVLDVNPKAPVLALAADVPARFDSSLLRKADMLEVHLIPKGERAALLIGLQVDPRTVFDVERTETIETVGDMTVDLAALGPRIPGLPPAAFAVLSGMGPLTGETQVVDATLGWRLHLSTSPGVKRAPFEVTPQPDFASPIWGFEPGKGDTCLLEATTGVGQLFDALAQVMAANRAQFVAKGLEELKPSLDCAAADPQTQPAVAGFYRLFAHIMTMQAESGDPVSVIPVLKSICDTTKDPWICAQPERLAALPTAAVPAVKSHVDFAPRYPPATPILVTAKGVFHQNKPADLKTLAKGMDPASIAVDKTLTFAAAVPVLRALSGLKLQVQVQTEGGRRSVPLGDAYRAVKPMQPPSPGLAQPPGVLDMANLSKGGVLDVAKLPKGGVLQALKDTPATDVLDDARWHVAVAPGKATVRRRLTGAIVFDGAVGDGSALEAAFDHKAALVQIDPATPWPQALQVLAVLGPKARLTETPPPKERAPVLDAPVDTRDKAVLQRVIRRNQRQVRYCYEKQLMKNPALAGKLHAAFEIQMDGSVSKVEIEASEPLKPVGECIARRIKRWQFPTATTVTKVRYPFIFKSN
jgi:hypothetical protein